MIKIKRNLKYQRGQVMMIATMFFLSVSLVIIFGLSNPILKQQKIVSDLFLSRQSYFLAEAGLEDAIYKLETGRQVPASDTLVLNGSTATVTTADTAEGKQISSAGDVSSSVRKVQSVVVVGTGLSFHYGVQSGVGGFILSNNAGVNGNVYSNGNITGSNGSYITGSAFAAGSTSTITGVRVGTGSTGDAWAHTVRNSTILGRLYCAVGSGNNKACDTSKPDPAAEEFPVPVEDIDQWKSDALLGGVFNGNKTINSTSNSLGPIKIAGDLNVTNGAALTLTGTVWVTGNITLSNNSSINLSSTYGGSSGILVTDGRVSVSNNGTFSGSGTTGSYLMVLTTSDCPTSSSCSGNSAISIGNNAGAVVLNAQNGTVSFSNGAGANVATARTISLNNNAVITYTSGLVSLNFSSGPGGEFDILDWKEIQ